MRKLDFYNKLFEFYVSNITVKALRKSELDGLISDIRTNRGLKSRDRNKIKTFLLENFFTKDISEKLGIYLLKDRNADIFDIASTASRYSFFSYQTALQIYGLIKPLSENIFLTKERKPQANVPNNDLTQELIDYSFNSEPRSTSNKQKYKKFTINIIVGQSQNEIGIVKYNNHIVSDLERTLIDCVVRPFYAGGYEVILKAFKAAKGTLDVEKLYEYYSKMKFIYPYYQSIGFYLEQSGYNKSQFKPFLNYEQEFDFYLDYNIEEKSYNKKWRVYFPA
jgi:predicted transcriptional regulator of viral defense system